MESRQTPTTDPNTQASQKPQEANGKPKRFRLVRLEERIAPSTGGNGSVVNTMSMYILRCAN